MSLSFTKNFPTLPLNNAYYLREHNEKDIQSFFNYYGEEVNQYIIAPKPKDLNDAKAEIQYCKNLFHFKRGIYWSIALKDTDEMIGAIGITVNAINRRAELHYDLAKPYWNLGIITQAIQAVLAYAFQELGLIRIEALTMKDNVASQKVLIKNNFIYEGCLHAYKFYEGQAMDVDMFAITLDQYRNHHGNT